MLCHTLTNVLSSNTKPAGTGDSGMMVPSSIEPKGAGDCQKNQEERGTQKEKNTKKKTKGNRRAHLNRTCGQMSILQSYTLHCNWL
jgi:hypothetical protein